MQICREFLGVPRLLQLVTDCTACRGARKRLHHAETHILFLLSPLSHPSLSCSPIPPVSVFSLSPSPFPPISVRLSVSIAVSLYFTPRYLLQRTCRDYSFLCPPFALYHTKMEFLLPYGLHPCLHTSMSTHQRLPCLYLPLLCYGCSRRDGEGADDFVHASAHSQRTAQPVQESNMLSI